MKKLKYVCKICGWVYDPAEHDNVAFEDLLADWHCPVCGVGKDDFEPAYNWDDVARRNAAPCR